MARIGVMGCGLVADYGHIPAILDTPGLELAALYDPDPHRVAESGGKYGVAGASDRVDAFFDAHLDAVLVASPAGTHKANVLMAAERGIHVLCEKPLALTDEDAEEMIAAMERAGKMLLTGFVYRFSPVAQQIKRWIEEGVVGEIRALRLIYVWDLHGRWEQLADGNWIESPRWHGRMVEGGPLVDCGVHQIDLARWWTGSEPMATCGHGAWLADYDAPDHLWLQMDHASGAHTAVEVSFSYGHTVREPHPHFSYHLVGTGGVLRYDREGYVLEARTGERTIQVPGASEKNFPGMYAALAEALRTGEPGHLPTGRDGLVATQIAERATRQAIERRVQTTKSEISESRLRARSGTTQSGAG
jgi:predicted dehydrogenase